MAHSVSCEELGILVKQVWLDAGTPRVSVMGRHIHASPNTIYRVFSGENGNWVTIEKVLKYCNAGEITLKRAHSMWIEANTDKKINARIPHEPIWAKELTTAIKLMIGALDTISSDITGIRNSFRVEPTPEWRQVGRTVDGGYLYWRPAKEDGS